MWNALSNLLTTKPQIRLIGVDRIGNRYVEVTYPNKQPSRQVEFFHPHYDPKSIPLLWHRWLNYTSDNIPTEQDLDDWEMNQLLLKEKVKKLEEKDAKIREQQIKAGELKVAEKRKLDENQKQQSPKIEFTKVEATSQKIITDLFHKTRIISTEAPLEMEETRPKRPEIVEQKISTEPSEPSPPALSFHDIVRPPFPRKSRTVQEIDVKELEAQETTQLDLNERPKGAEVLVVPKSKPNHRNVDENLL